jgi:hypothetical protein
VLTGWLAIGRVVVVVHPPAATVATDWLTAIGTIGAVVVALGLALQQGRFSRPKLSLEYEPGPPYRVVVTEASAVVAAYYRLRVVAKSGKRPAEDVEVMVVGAEMDGQPVDIADQSLIWSNAETTTRHLPAGSWRFVDVLRVQQDGNTMTVRVGAPPIDNRHVLRDKSVTLELLLTARDAPGRRYTVTANRDGTWTGDAPHPPIEFSLRDG